mgnify:CR=1 FL=1
MGFPAGLTVKATKVHTSVGKSSDIEVGAVYQGRVYSDLWNGRKLKIVINGQIVLTTSEIEVMIQTQDQNWIIHTKTSIYLVEMM